MNEKTKDIIIISSVVLYVICPFDFDFIPGLGWVDDVAVVGWALKYFANKKKDPLQSHTTQIERGEVIDVDCRSVR